MKTWNKATEKKTLLELAKGDTYFADTFDMDQLNIMCANIDNDFPLLAGTCADPAEIRDLKKDLLELEAKYNMAKQELLEDSNDHKAVIDHLKWTIDMLLLKIFRHNCDNPITLKPSDFEFEGISDVTPEAIVRLKFNTKIPWDDADLSFIMQQISKP